MILKRNEGKVGEFSKALFWKRVERSGTFQVYGLEFVERWNNDSVIARHARMIIWVKPLYKSHGKRYYLAYLKSLARKKYLSYCELDRVCFDVSTFV